MLRHQEAYPDNRVYIFDYPYFEQKKSDPLRIAFLLPNRQIDNQTRYVLV